MSTYQLILFTIAAVLGYMIVTDKNVAEYVVLKLQLIRINAQRYYLMAKLHPRNPITNYVMKRKMSSLAKELAKKYNIPDEE